VARAVTAVHRRLLLVPRVVAKACDHLLHWPERPRSAAGAVAHHRDKLGDRDQHRRRHPVLVVLFFGEEHNIYAGMLARLNREDGFEKPLAAHIRRDDRSLAPTVCAMCAARLAISCLSDCDSQLLRSGMHARKLNSLP